MRSLFISFCLLISISFQVVYGQISLDDCQSKARENYPLIQQYDLIEQSKEYTLHNANKAYLPQLDVTLIGGIIDGLPTFSLPGSEPPSSSNLNMISVLQLNQTIWDGGMTKANKNIIRASSEIEKADLEIALYSLEERVNNLFFGILLIEEQIRQLEILKSTISRNMTKVEIAVVNGTAFKSDIDEVKVQIINTDQQVEELKFNRSAYIKVLSAMIGEPLADDVMFARPEVTIAYESMAVNRPELSLFQNQEHLLEAQNKINKAIMYPKIGVLAFGTFIQPGVDFGTETINNILVAGLTVNWNLMGLYRNGNNNKLAEVNLQKIKVQKETFLFNINLDLAQTERALEKYKNLIEQDKELLVLKGSIKNSYEIKYENGVSTMSELLDRVNDESTAKQNLVVHEIQYLMKAYQYKNKSGN